MTPTERARYDALHDLDACCGSDCPACHPDLWTEVHMDGAWRWVREGDCELSAVPVAECVIPDCSHRTDEYQPAKRREEAA